MTVLVMPFNPTQMLVYKKEQMNSLLSARNQHSNKNNNKQ